MPTEKEIQEFLDAGGARGYASTAQAVADHFNLDCTYTCMECNKEIPNECMCTEQEKT
jgi:hypothetical protein